MIESNSASSSANEVSISTRVAGWFARISRVASMPLPSVRRTSITTTSGPVRSASSIASRTLPASAVPGLSAPPPGLPRHPPPGLTGGSPQFGKCRGEVTRDGEGTAGGSRQRRHLPGTPLAQRDPQHGKPDRRMQLAQQVPWRHAADAGKALG